MIIGIDGNEANQLNRVGVGQFALNVISGLEKIDTVNSYLIYLKEKPLADLPKERVGFKYRIVKPGKLWTQISLPIKLFTQKEKLNLFFTPSHYAPRFSPFPTVISIMDLWHHRHPEQFNKKDLYQLLKWEAYSVKNSSKIITISEFSKNEIIKFYNYPKEKIFVAYPGFTNYQSPSTKYQTNINDKISNIKDKYGITGDYLLYLGTLQPKKNIVGLIDALNILISQYPNIFLVLAGKKGWMYEEIFNMVKDLGLEKNIVFTGFISDEDKPSLISGAKIFILPSFYEGFGIPVLEAMSLGVPVVLSKEGSLPEVGGSSAYYFNPYDPKDMADCIKKVLRLNVKQRNGIINEGKIQVKKFSWDVCCQKILQVFNNYK